MGFLTWLPDALRAAGGDVVVLPGAETRTTRSSGLVVLGVIWHHTATSTRWLDGHVAALLRDGRRDLRGPLVQIGIERDGTIVIIALGRANHDGYGRWGNDALGIEFYNAGDGEPLTDAQIRSGILVTLVVLRHENLPAENVLMHRESAGHKVDLLPEVLDPDDLRATLADDLTQPEPLPPATTKDFIVPTIWNITDRKTRNLFAVMPDGLVLLDEATSYALVKGGAPVVEMNTATFQTLYRGPRATSFNDDPALEV